MKNVFFALILALAGCASTTSNTTTPLSDTMEIIKAAANSAPKGVPGRYTLQIVATGSQGQYVYLNTEKDYRDQRAITVALHPKAIAQLSAKYGMSPQEYFVDKTIVVNGKAQRVKIAFLSEGKPTDKYYYQTHIRLMDISQIEVVG
ncbi:hypothetical protein KUL42_40200 [Alteromonas sp. KUL42]|uniref:hypothetical protein n=1 Tax=Alteromonas sp. KUL42 TaxID=2480797 RepID=UPI00079A7798|nr:hypothetical protein [Alteromonas sp. KUL42]KXJ59670.1 MAG: hypothetical protein AXW14_05250 [Alteromonas sp. Nap_26]TAP31840.1 hypothetical protein EYR97_19440 [Alteromonas sp. KUL42]GEA09259.1 hypothetical protein KUL42_40200 [Alteromonas sp. KUL42]